MENVIASKNNPIVKRAASLKDKKGRREHGAFLVEGEKMTAECLDSKMDVLRVYFCEKYVGKYEERILDAMKRRGMQEDRIVRLSESAFSCLSEEKTPQGVICEASLPKNAIKEPTGDCLLLDGVSDPGNLGTIIRTANAAGYKEIYLVACADAYSPKCVRSSMSGVFFTTLYNADRETTLNVLKNTPILAADMGGENVFTHQPPERFVLAIGNEANGLSEEVKNAAARTIAIPMRGEQESLNAGVAAAVCMYTLRRERFAAEK